MVYLFQNMHYEYHQLYYHQFMFQKSPLAPCSSCLREKLADINDHSSMCDLLLLIIFNCMQNISWLSVCAEDCHMWRFLSLHEHFILTIYKSLIYTEAGQFCTGTIWGVSERARFSTQGVNQHVEHTDWSGHSISPGKSLGTVWNSDLERSSAN